MGLSTIIKSFFSSSQSKSENLFQWKISPFDDEIEFTFDKKYQNKQTETAQKNPLFGFQLAYLAALKDEYNVVEFPNGFALPASIVPNLDDNFATLFDLPPKFSGSFKSDIRNRLENAAFELRLIPVLPNGEQILHYELEGCFLKLAENERYFLSLAQFLALQAVKKHQNLTVRTEYENSLLIFQLQIAKQKGVNIDLQHFETLEMISPDKIGIAIEEKPNGDIELIPTFKGVDITDLKTRTGQLTKSDTCLLRVKNQFVLFDEKRLDAVKDILVNPRIPKAQVAKFLANPTAYLDANLIDLDVGFSLRAFGAERFVHHYFGDTEKSGIDWFTGSNEIEPPQALISLISDLEKWREVQAKIKNAVELGAGIVDIDGRQIDISDVDTVDDVMEGIHKKLSIPKVKGGDSTSDEAKPEKAVIGIENNDEFLGFTAHLTDQLAISQEFDQANLKRLPFPHQQEGIHWLLSHFRTQAEFDKPSGALLADDMGLGKTYMTLVAAAEKYRFEAEKGNTLKPVLVVAPLSLLENWQAEIDETFKQSPFKDVVVLQADADLKRFKLGRGNETKQVFDEEDVLGIEQIRFALKVGKNFGDERLDMPQRLVLTTYQTLRDFQFSFGLIDWSLVIFDEAQNLKNPNALASRAAKGLKAEFKLLATGTPVENSLKEFWSLMDTAVPGLLGAWKEFHSSYIKPILDADEQTDTKISVGKALREKVGCYMLRRTKAEKLTGLPEKIIYSGDDSEHTQDVFLPVLAAQMQGIQLQKYNEIIDGVRYCDVEDKREVILSSLRNLKVTSIHYQLDVTTDQDLLQTAEKSAKIRAMLQVLDEIKSRNEKVLIFAETKKVQAYLKMLMLMRYGLDCEIINGETQAVVTKRSDRSRKKLIDEFQAKEGFQVMIMSPIAAGVGLTVVGANNVIHLERHWNPAKEAQATDRVYRIGQQKTVNVYLPMALHPTQKSFDLQLNQLLGNKIDLSNAVVANPEIEPSALTGIFS